MMKLSEILTWWASFSNISDAGKKDFRDMAKQAEQLESENESLRSRDRVSCCMCNEKTTQISFRLGYGSSRDGESVCWDCASKFDALLK